MDFVFPTHDYLNNLIDIVNKKRHKFEYYEINPEECVITYLSNRKLDFNDKKSGLMKAYYMQQYNLKESNNKKSNMKKYLKIYRRDGKIVRLDSFNQGRFDVMHLAYYGDDKLYLFPFSADRGYYPTYSYVSCYEGDYVYEEYMVNGSQIIHEQYTKTDNAIVYTNINYANSGNYKELSKMAGIIKMEEKIDFSVMYSHSWLDDRQKQNL